MRLENAVGSAKIETADWPRLSEKRKDFKKVIAGRLGEMAHDPKVGSVIPITPPLKKGLDIKSSADIPRVRVFTFTSKMSCASFSIPAGPIGSKGTCPQADLSEKVFKMRLSEIEGREGMVNADWVNRYGYRQKRDKKFIDAKKVPGLYICDLCYAGKGNYGRLDSVQVYQLAHQVWVERALARGSFVVEMMTALQADLGNESLMNRELASSNHFRIHDSGDFFSIPYMLGWFEVCRQLPHIRFWAPTRVWLQKHFRAAMLQSRPGGEPTIPANLSLRPSSLVYGASAPMVNGLAAGSTSSLERLDARGHWDCPAYLGVEASCASVCCRTCWDRPEIPVNYLVH